MRIFKLLLAVFTALNFSFAQEQKMVDFSKLEHAKHFNGELSNEQLYIVKIASLTASGKEERLKAVLLEALNAGLGINEIREILSHQSAYIGFPLSLNGLIVFNNLLKEQGEKGVKFKEGKEANKVPDDTDFYALGMQVQKYIFGSDYSGTVLFDAPAVDHGLKAHLFGYLFSRDNLSFVEREITTISTLCVLKNVDMQLKSHLGGAKNLGLNERNFEQIFSALESEFGKGATDRARELLK